MDCYKNIFLMLATISLLPGLASAEIVQKNADQPHVVQPEMVTIRGGYFKMGSPVNEDGRSNNENPHNVLVKDFSIGKNEVTVGEYRHFVNSTNYLTETNKKVDDDCHHWQAPSFGQSDQHPVVIRKNDLGFRLSKIP